MKKLTAVLLSIIMVLSLVSGVAYATDENISVTVKFDASVVAEDMDTLYSDLVTSGIIDGETTNLPSDITVTVPKGSSVKEVLQAAQEESYFTVVGYEDNYVTQVGFVGSEVLENLVSTSVGYYPSGNIFNSAGWSFYIDGEGLTSSIDAATVENDSAVLEGRFRLAVGWDSNWNAVYYDEIFLENYHKLKELTEKSIDTSTFSEEQKQKYEAEKAESSALLSEIYNEACLNDEVSALLKEAHPTFKTNGGMWIGYIEKKGEALHGANSPAEKIESANSELSTATDPTDESVTEAKERIDALLENIAGAYTEKTSYWEVMDMGAYKKYASETDKVLSETAMREFVKTSIAEIAETDTDRDLTKAILALTAAGKDATKLYKENSTTPINAIEKLDNAEQSTSAWSAPNTLAVYNREEYANREKEIALVKALLFSQDDENGAWDEFGTIDTTANVIAGLAFYMDDGEVKTKVNEAIEKALAYLSTQQNDDGSFSDSWSGANSNSTAMVAIALAAAGVDVENDARFIKNGNSIIVGLLKFALADNSGFGHTDNITASDYSTEQAFRALIALSGAMKEGKAYNVYDFNGITLSPAREAGETTEGGISPEPSEDHISISLTIKTDTEYWLRGYNVTLEGKGACVYDAFVKACSENGITYKASQNGYISSITKDGKTLSERDLGPNSGWLYKVNGISPLEGTRECAIKNGDSIRFYYTSDYTKEPGSGDWRNETEEEEKPEEEENVQTEKITFADVSETYWAAEYISHLAEQGILKGRDNGFFPEEKITRAEFVAVLSRLSEESFPDYKSTFSDVNKNAWYSDCVLWAYENGITNGISGSEFAPEKNITREDMAVMIVRYAALKEITLKEEASTKTFSDKADISDYAAEAVKKMQRAGIISGFSDGSFAPKRFATRAETAKMISVLLSVIEK